MPQILIRAHLSRQVLSAMWTYNKNTPQLFWCELCATDFKAVFTLFGRRIPRHSVAANHILAIWHQRSTVDYTLNVSQTQWILLIMWDPTSPQPPHNPAGFQCSAWFGVTAVKVILVMPGISSPAQPSQSITLMLDFSVQPCLCKHKLRNDSGLL